MFQSRAGLWAMRELSKRINPDFEQYFFPDLEEQAASQKVIEILLKTGGTETEGISLDMLRRDLCVFILLHPGTGRYPSTSRYMKGSPSRPEAIPPPLRRQPSF